MRVHASDFLVRLLKSVREGVVVFGASGEIHYVNHAARRLFRMTPTEMARHPIWRHVEVPESLRGKVGKGQEGFGEVRIQPFGREPLPVHASFQPVQGSEDSTEPLFMAIFHAGAERENAAPVLTRDPLTGLANRAAFFSELKRKMIQAERDEVLVSVMFLDLDRFKGINDSYGHSVGDDLLKAVAGRLQRCVRDRDLVARLGGDEFAIIQYGVEHVNGIHALAGRVISAMDEKFSLQGSKVSTGTSIGISVFPIDGDSPEELLGHADMALYQAKAEGRGRYAFFSVDLKEQAQMRKNLEDSLRNALLHDEFTLVYQPKMDVETGRIHSVEALLRWDSPFGPVQPSEFVPIAEELGVIVELGEWVMDRAIRQAGQWARDGVDLRVSFNVSPAQMRDPGFFRRLHATLLEHKVSPDRIEIEVTESSLMKHSRRILGEMQALSEIGVRFAIDDFGTGYSSLSYLSRLPIHTLKIDRSFVCQIGGSSRSDNLVRVIAEFARAMEMRVVAEGIESLKQVRYLERIGCDELQGYFISHPLDVDLVEAFVAAFNGRELREGRIAV